MHLLNNIFLILVGTCVGALIFGGTVALLGILIAVVIGAWKGE